MEDLQKKIESIKGGSSDYLGEVIGAYVKKELSDEDIYLIKEEVDNILYSSSVYSREPLMFTPPVHELPPTPRIVS